MKESFLIKHMDRIISLIFGLAFILMFVQIIAAGFIAKDIQDNGGLPSAIGKWVKEFDDARSGFTLTHGEEKDE